jgi:hypothetical protein
MAVSYMPMTDRGHLARDGAAVRLRGSLVAVRNDLFEARPGSDDRLPARLRAEGELLRANERDVGDADEGQERAKMGFLRVHRLRRSLTVKTTSGLDHDARPYGDASDIENWMAVTTGQDFCGPAERGDRAALSYPLTVPR